jgi:endogenous inhibitor of DNA gyrase (YacG/DUF329 family)
MKLFIKTTCPSCAADLVIVEEAAPGRKGSLFASTTVEVECGECGWEFACDEDGAITDDGGADREGPFTIDDEGELDAEALRQVRCPRCQQPHEVGGRGPDRLSALPAGVRGQGAGTRRRGVALQRVGRRNRGLALGLVWGGRRGGAELSTLRVRIRR